MAKMEVPEKLQRESSQPLLAGRLENRSKHRTTGWQRSNRILFVLVSTSCLSLWLVLNLFPLFEVPRDFSRTTLKGLCNQVPALKPRHETPELARMEDYLQSEGFKNASISRLSKSVQIPTESFDDLGPVGEDERWNVMYDFAAYLKEAFPQVHEILTLETVNTHGLLYTWTGTDPFLKPTLLMAHQDVVPVPKSTVDAWTYPPFSGHYDGEFVWGRGSSDCKNQLIGELEAIEELINAGFQPHRTVLLSFGFDEEISGWNGAAYLAPYILERYGHGGVAAIVDEGSGFDSHWGTKMAIPGVGEKGYTDVTVTINTPGGHSSIPPDHTGIGIMSELISLIERDQYATHLADDNPFLQLLQCGAEHAPKFPSKIKKLIKKRLRNSKSDRICKAKKDRLALEVAKIGPAAKYLMQTSIAVDIISGGVKINALPERTTAMINHRVNIGEQTAIVHGKIARLAKEVAKKHGLTLHAFNNQTQAANSIILSHSEAPLEPAPVTPTESDSVSPWTILAGTIRNLYGEDILVAPGIMTGNTDTKHYWNLTKHIFRFSPGWDGKTIGFGNIHTVNEKVSVDAHVNLVRWVSLFVRNMDEY